MNNAGATLTTNTVDDLRAADRAAERLSRRCFRSGWIVFATGVIGILTCWIIAGTDIEADADARLLCGITLAALLALGATLIGVGATGVLIRPMRDTTWRLLDDEQENRQENRQRIDRIENAIDVIAGHMPEHQALHNWKGFGEAALKGLAQQTGTEGQTANTRIRPSHLGLAPNPRTPSN